MTGVCPIITFEDEKTGTEYTECVLSAATRGQNPIESYNELIKAGCPDTGGGCIYNLGKRVPKHVAPLTIG